MKYTKFEIYAASLTDLEIMMNNKEVTEEDRDYIVDRLYDIEKKITKQIQTIKLKLED